MCCFSVDGFRTRIGANRTNCAKGIWVASRGFVLRVPHAQMCVWGSAPASGPFSLCRSVPALWLTSTNLRCCIATERAQGGRKEELYLPRLRCLRALLLGGADSERESARIGRIARRGFGSLREGSPNSRDSRSDFPSRSHIPNRPDAHSLRHSSKV